MSKVCIAVIHGMGSQQPGYSQPMREKIERRLGDQAARVRWREIYWADILEPREREYLRDANADNDLDWMRLRRFMLRAFGDASAYRRTGADCTSAYREIHTRIRDAIAELDAGDAAPLILMAHSLGGHIISNYVWDMQQGTPVADVPDSPFQRLETLAGIITFGCNIPLFTLAWRKSDIRPIRFPGRALPPAARARARWLNFFDPDDVLGYPLRPINARYARVVSEDIAINAGGLLASWNPLSHQGYWTDGDFIRPVARFIAGWL